MCKNYAGYTATLAHSSTGRTTVRAAPATVGTVVVRNLGALAYLALYDDTAGSPATNPRFIIPVPATDQVEVRLGGLHVQAGLRLGAFSDFACTAGSAGDLQVSLTLD